MIVGEIKKIVKRTSFKIVVIILFLDVIIDFLLTCKSYYGSELTWVRSAHLCTILNNDVSNFLQILLSFHSQPPHLFLSYLLVFLLGNILPAIIDVLV